MSVTCWPGAFLPVGTHRCSTGVLNEKNIIQILENFHQTILLPFVNGKWWARSKKIKKFQILTFRIDQKRHIEVVTTQLAVGVLIVGIQVVSIMNYTRRTLFDTDFQSLPQFLDVEKEQIRSIDGVKAGHFEIRVFFIVFNAACVSEGIIAVDKTQRIAVHKREYSHNDLEDVNVIYKNNIFRKK